ncbi:hypothetical protein B0A69_16570 [Chryseobacterium shigense]|uniref:DUF2306 domain-containing protein n=1 Tax=Chryseobacterium shigense TaxID=297244 RepID=A0A1N7HWY1_9FLAO|nr:hypothetical protein [Chryseobacterium shigense]PQA92032.1 hypothetical protein B0A69_16570 [Chryseobacterium shigense]SIS29369.1 hypothetical protein SAMN05421639_101441 [Chryseobacterium shigense]
MDTFLHSANIAVHVISGSLALIIGLLILLKAKGTSLHRKLGSFFILCMMVVVTTGIFGVIVFKRNLFLLLITVLAGYNTYSGFRILKEKSNRFYAQDLIAMFLALSTAFVFMYYLKSIGFYWNPVVIYSGVGYLLLVITYDIFRYAIPKSAYGRLWRYEHSSKMISALGALLSAFIGTILPDHKPYSQILPSLFMTFVMVFFNIKIYLQIKGQQKTA